MKITICGGGGLGHVCAGVLASQQGVEVNILTGHPQNWSHHVLVDDPSGKIFAGSIVKVTNDPAEIVSESDVVLLCVPGHLIEKTILQLRPYLNSSTILGSIVSSTGFFFKSHELLDEKIPLFGFQRVPFISRINKYGQSAHLLGYKSSLAVAIEHYSQPELLAQKLSQLFLTPVTLLHNFYEASLTNSNPILHTGRLYTMWGHWDGTPYDHNILFYKEWDIDSAQKLIDMDNEFMGLLDKLPITKGVIPSLLDYYESHDAESLAAKIRSIAAFQTILSPMKEVDNGWVPDFSSRYFTEDFPFGLRYIKQLAEEYHLNTPHIDEVLSWGMSVAVQ